MFTGIIKGVGRIKTIREAQGDRRIEVITGSVDAGAVGDSLAVNGVCLTVSERLDDGFAADVSRETLALTTLGSLGADARVNLEPALRAGDPLGGHLVSGHVDGLAELLQRDADARSVRMRFAVKPELARYLARKGSVTLDGISLTVNDAADAAFSVNIVPHTLEATNLDERRPGERLNLEVDMLARYVERLLDTDTPA